MPTRVEIDPTRLRALCACVPPLSWVQIATAFGVSESVIMVRAKELGIKKLGCAWGARRALPLASLPTARERRHEPESTRRRCMDCGGIREVGTPHDCRPAEPYERGLLFERAPLSLTDRERLVLDATQGP